MWRFIEYSTDIRILRESSIDNKLITSLSMVCGLWTVEHIYEVPGIGVQGARSY